MGIVNSMSPFTSKRERRLWLWTLVVVMTIYSTLGLAATLSGILRDQDLIGGAGFVGMLLIVAAVVVQGLKRRPGAVEIVIVLGVAAVYLMLAVRLTASPEERTHLFEYGVVALLIYEALTERASNGRRVPARALLAIGATALLGAIDEGIQALIPSRVFDPIDMGVNALAGLVAVSGSVALAWARRLGSKIRSDRGV